MTISCTVTLHSLVLGNKDGNTGLYRPYYIASAVKMILDVHGGEQLDTAMGPHMQLTATGWTDAAVAEGDVVEQANGTLWKVTAAPPNVLGDLPLHTRVEMSKMLESTGSGSDNWVLIISAAPSGFGSCVPTGLQVLLAGQTIDVTATPTTAETQQFTEWLLDGVSVGSTNPYTVPAQSSGSIHYLTAVFTWKVLTQPQRSGLSVIFDGGFPNNTISETVEVLGADASESISETVEVTVT